MDCVQWEVRASGLSKAFQSAAKAPFNLSPLGALAGACGLCHSHLRSGPQTSFVRLLFVEMNRHLILFMTLKPGAVGRCRKIKLSSKCYLYVLFFFKPSKLAYVDEQREPAFL